MFANASICQLHGLTLIVPVDHIPLIRATFLPGICAGIVSVIAIAPLFIITVSTVFIIADVAVTTTKESFLDASFSDQTDQSYIRWIVD